MTVIVKEGEGHFLPATKDQGPIVDFDCETGIVEGCRAAVSNLLALKAIYVFLPPRSRWP
jgi:hypothetical protein